MTPLTSKQEAFARAYVELGNARGAYAKAGYSQGNSLPTQQKKRTSCCITPSFPLGYASSRPLHGGARKRNTGLLSTA